MMRLIPILLIAIASAQGASAASLLVVADKTRYFLGETVTLSVVADDSGATTYEIFGRLLYDGALLDNGTRNQITLVGPYGKWNLRALAQGDTNTSSPMATRRKLL